MPPLERPGPRVPIILLPDRESKVDNEGSHAIGRHPAAAGRQTNSRGGGVRRHAARESLADTSLANLVARAVEVLGSRPRALAWLRAPLAGLAGRTPLEVMADAESRQQVEDILGRIEHGVFG